ncbi:unnamed protein product [Spodoptera littoralis]|uniref:Sodium channel protein Nach n=1 Tax=Spodoptera littoralis TaxID=7109 RepID=A0A9P0HZX5_SPOLI|nr:unnamed protein product [Spodoptera littoralis]CAH1637630.1 unnamed protein product [Spodoptera littoralis]
MDNFRRFLRNYCLNSTIVGLKYFYIYPDILSRCFWAVNMISVLAMSFSITYLLYNRFEVMPTRIAIENQFEPINSLPYPAITMCTPNQITQSALEYFNTTLMNVKNRNFVNRYVKATGFTKALIVVIDYDEEDAMNATLLYGGSTPVMYTDWSEFPSDDELFIHDNYGESFHILSATYTYCSEEVKSLPLWRCFWVVNMISVLAMSFSITYFLYNRFEEMPTRIAIENQFEPIENLPYPAITLCTPNQLTQSALEYFNSTLIEGNTTELETYLPLVLGLYEFISLTNQTENLLKSFQDLLEMNRFTISDLLSRVPQNCENFLKRCYLEGKQYNCSDLFKPILTTHGYCCSFNNVYMFNGKCKCTKNVKNRNFVNRYVTATGFTKTLLVVIDFQEEDAINATMLYGGATPVMYSDWSEFPSTTNYFSSIIMASHSTPCPLLTHIALKKSNRCLCGGNMSNWLTSENCPCPRDCESRKYRGDVTLGNFRAVPYVLNDPYEGNKTGLETYIPLVLGFYEYIDITDQTRDKLKRFQDLLEKNRYTVPELLSRVPQMCKRFLKRCYLERKMYNCTDLFKPILTARGYCCTFNNNYIFNHRMNTRDPNFVNRTVKATGFTNALVVVTDYEMEDSITGTLLNAGAVPVMYTDWTEFPSDDELTYIDGYGESFHIISATYTYCSDEVKSLPVRSRNCYFPDEHVLDHFWSYHNSDCDHLCYANAVKEACNCTPPYIPHSGRSLFCTLVDIPCIIDVKWNMSNWLTTENCMCLRDCESRRYHGEMSLGNFKAIPYTIKNLYDGLDLNNSTSAFHFFFPNPTYLKQKQETVMSIISLASNLGGVFGLSMGFSCISFLEILFYIYLGLKMYIRNKLAKVFLAISNHYN